MKKFFRAAVCLLGTLLFAFSSVAAQAKKPEDTFVVRDGSWQLKSGGEPQGTRGASFAKKMWWYAIDPKTDSAAKGLTRGVLLYDARADSSKAYSFLPTAEEQAWVEQITFSPDRKKMVMACRLNRFASGLYVYDVASLTLEKTSGAIARSGLWTMRVLSLP